MKKLFGTFWGILIFAVCFIVILPFLLLYLIFELLYAPICYIKIKRTRYQKDFPNRYKLFDRPHSDNEVYTIIKERGLPIEYFKFYEDYYMLGDFLLGDVLTVFSEPFFFDRENGLWLYDGPCDFDEGEEHGCDCGCEDGGECECEHSDEDCLSVDATVELFLEHFKKNAPDRACNRVVFFYDQKTARKNYGDAAIEIMRGMDCFVLYEKGGLEAAIIDFVAAESAKREMA